MVDCRGVEALWHVGLLGGAQDRWWAAEVPAHWSGVTDRSLHRRSLKTKEDEVRVNTRKHIILE